ncbi:50S ribosomal protein L4 [Elusimicrobiota bacterium]
MEAKTPKLTGEWKDIRVNKSLLHEVVDAYLSNKRRGSAHTKTKGDVSGSGRKPWRQKGTGRARVSTARSPLWRGGGVIFGPTGEQNYEKKLPRKKKKIAFMQALKSRVTEKNLKVVSEIKLAEPKTREAVKFIQKVFKDKCKILILIDDSDIENTRAFSNIKDVTINYWNNVNTYELIRNEKIIYSKKAWDNTMNLRGIKEDEKK